MFYFFFSHSPSVSFILVLVPFFSFFLCFFSLLSFRLLLLLAFSLNGTSFCFLKFWCLSLWKRLNMKATKTDFSSCCWWLYFFLFVSQTRALHSFGVLVSYNYDYQDLRLFSIIAVVPHFFIIINVLFSSPCSSYSFENEKVWNECRKKICGMTTTCYKHRFSSQTRVFIASRQRTLVNEFEKQQQHKSSRNRSK